MHITEEEARTCFCKTSRPDFFFPICASVSVLRLQALVFFFLFEISHCPGVSLHLRQPSIAQISRPITPAVRSSEDDNFTFVKARYMLSLVFR